MDIFFFFKKYYKINENSTIFLFGISEADKNQPSQQIAENFENFNEPADVFAIFPLGGYLACGATTAALLSTKIINISARWCPDRKCKI